MVEAKIYAFSMSGWDSPKDCKEMQPSTFGIFIFKIRGVLGGERERWETPSKRCNCNFIRLTKRNTKNK